MRRRIVDTKQWLGEIDKIVKEGHEAPLVVTGGSMSPFLAGERDAVLLTKPEKPFQKGEIVFYRRRDGQYVMHRIMKCTKTEVWLAGDAQTVLEGPLPITCIFAVVNCARRKNKWIKKGDVQWDFFAGPWRWAFPVRRKILKYYVKMKGYMKR